MQRAKLDMIRKTEWAFGDSRNIINRRNHLQGSDFIRRFNQSVSTARAPTGLDQSCPVQFV